MVSTGCGGVSVEDALATLVCSLAADTPDSLAPAPGTGGGVGELGAARGAAGGERVLRAPPPF
jgi:hypothetical protein